MGRGMRSKSNYRLAAENAEMRDELIAAAVKIVEIEGISALTMSRLAKEFAISRPTIHYYIGTIDNLLIDIIQSRSEKIHTDVGEALKRNDPLDVIWKLGSNASIISIEMSALAMRNPNIRKEVRKLSKDFSDAFIEILDNHRNKMGIKPKYSSQIIVSMIQSLSQGLSIKRNLDLLNGLSEIESEFHSIIFALSEQFDGAG
jgi:AcrR family transcriptional regulator